MKICCCGFGHRDLFCDIRAELNDVIEYLVTKKGVDAFYTGGMGNFDAEFTNAVRAAKTKYNNISIILVKPYFSNELNTNKEYYEYLYDEVLICEESSVLHPKAAIGKRNRWMIDKSTYVVGCTRRDYGGTYTALKYAEKQGKQIIKIGQNKKSPISQTEKQV